MSDLEAATLCFFYPRYGKLSVKCLKALCVVFVQIEA